MSIREKYQAQLRRLLTMNPPQKTAEELTAALADADASPYVLKSLCRSAARKMVEALPRQDIGWHPEIDRTACVGCGKCAAFCAYGTLTMQDGKAAVSAPERCILLCDHCVPECPVCAIRFPPYTTYLELLEDWEKRKAAPSGPADAAKAPGEGHPPIVLKQEVFDAITAECLDVFQRGTPMTVSALSMRLMDVEGVPMHYPYHHYIQPAALLTLAALETGRSGEKLGEMLAKAQERSKTVPGGVCGTCGSCGAAVGFGIFVSVFTGASPMAKENWRWANEVTGKCLLGVASCPGPRCCKRTTFLAQQAGVPCVNERLGLHLTLDETVRCRYFRKNPDCLDGACPFHPEGEV